MSEFKKIIKIYNFMYKILKYYKNLESHKLLGKIYKFENLNADHRIVFNFYSNHVFKKNFYKYNYCNMQQSSISYYEFIKEKFYYNTKFKLTTAFKKNFSQKKYKKFLLKKTIPLCLNNFEIILKKNVWTMFLNESITKKLLYIYIKIFNKFETLKTKKYLKKIKQLFYNFIIKDQIFFYNMCAFNIKNFLINSLIKDYFKLYILYFKFFLIKIKKNLHKTYLEYSVKIPLQLFLHYSKYSGIKKLYGKFFNFFSLFQLCEFSTKIIDNLILNSLNINNKNFISFFKIQKTFKFWKRFQFLFLKFFLLNIKFKQSNNNWNLVLKIK